MKQRAEYFSNFWWPDYLFYLQKLPDRNQLVVPKTNQEINETSYEMVGVKMTVTNNGQKKSYFWHLFSCLHYVSNEFSVKYSNLTNLAKPHQNQIICLYNIMR
jgi:hypothetical protein